MSYILQCIDSARFTSSSLWNLVNYLTEILDKIKCKYGHGDKKCETCRIKYKSCNCCLEYTNFKDDLIEWKCLCCNKSYHNKFDKKLKEWFFNTYTFSNHGSNKFAVKRCLSLWIYGCLEKN